MYVNMYKQYRYMCMCIYIYAYAQRDVQMKPPISKANHDFRSSKNSPTKHPPSFGRLASRAAHMVSACELWIRTRSRPHVGSAGASPHLHMHEDQTHLADQLVGVWAF